MNSETLIIIILILYIIGTIILNWSEHDETK